MFKVEDGEIHVIMSKRDAEILLDDLSNVLWDFDGNVNHEFFEFRDGVEVMMEKIK